MTTNRLLPGLILPLLALILRTAAAQDDTATPPASEPAAPTLSEVANLVQALSAELVAAESRLVPDPETESIIEKVRGAIGRRADLESQMREAVGRRSSIYRLRVLRAETEDLRRRFGDWSSKLDERFDQRSRGLEAVRARRRELDRAGERSTDLPPALVDEARALRARATALEPELTERLNVLVDAQALAAKEKTGLGTLVEQIDAAMDRDAQELFGRDTPRLWQAWSTPVADDKPHRPFRQIWEEIGAYAKAHQGRLVAHGLFVVALAVLFTMLQRSARRGEEVDAGLRGAADALGDPLWAALMLGLLPSYWIHPLGPRSLSLIGYVTISIPLLIFLNKHLPVGLRPAARTLVAAVMLFFLVEFLTDDLSATRRIGLLLVAGVGGTAFARAQRSPVASETIPHPRVRALIVLAARLSGLTLGAGVFTNVLGYTRLTEQFARSTITSTYFGLLTFVGAILLQAFVDLSVRSRTLQSLRAVRNRTFLISRRLKNFVNVLAAVFWILVALVIARLFGPLRGGVTALLAQSFSIGDIRLSIGDFVVFGLTFWVALLIARFVRFTLEEGVLPAVSLPRGVPATVSKLTGYAIVTLGFMVALGAAGFPLDRLAFMAGAFGLGLGFGLQNLVANFVSGLILLIERPVQVGDTIEFGTRTGRVTRIGIRSSVVRTWDGAEVNVPNGELVSREVVNWTMSDSRRRLSIPVGVSYGTDPKRMPEILLPAATAQEGILDDPAPEVLFNGFGESSLNFELRCWTQSPDWIRYRSEITFAVHERLKEAGVEIPFPQRDLHLRSSAIGPLSPGEPG